MSKQNSFISNETEQNLKNKLRSHIEIYGAAYTIMNLNRNDITSIDHNLRRIPDRKTEMQEENLNYYMIRNFILHQYSGKYPFLSMRDVQKFYHFYRLIQTRNFDLLEGAMRESNELNDLLVNIYVMDLRIDEKEREKELEERNKKAEVESLLENLESFYKEEPIEISEKTSNNKVFVK